MKKKIIVIGGGFAGIQFIKKIDETLFDVLLIDKINHHQFQPLYYQVATSQLEPASISFPLRNIFKSKKNLQIRLAEVLPLHRICNRCEGSPRSFALKLCDIHPLICAFQIGIQEAGSGRRGSEIEKTGCIDSNNRWREAFNSEQGASVVIVPGGAV